MDRRNLLAAGLAVAWASVCPAEDAGIGIFAGRNDLGAVQHPGSANYDPVAQTYALAGSGKNMWAKADEHCFLWKKLAGDFILDARAHWAGAGADPHRKFGWIVRASLAADSAYADVAIHGDGLASLQFRRARGAVTEQIVSAATEPDVFQFARKGTRYSMSVARFGAPLNAAGKTAGTTTELDLDLGDEVYVGLFVCSHRPEVVEHAVFGNVRISIPAKDGFRPYRDYLGSRLETMDVATGARQTLHSVHDSLQAPNWTRDGKALLCNRNGRIVRFDLATKQLAPVDTGGVVNNNNDHVLSFDGTQLGISSAAGPLRKSTIYTLPAGGGAPRQVTASDRHSYLHGWSPDGKFLLFTGERNGDFDIFRIPAAGGAEVNLTKAPGLDDGAEYAPDGQTIYFNSTRGGRMQIWKMDADGGRQTAVVADENNNWFPHVSPDGKAIVFLSFPGDVDPRDHPFYKQVQLRLAPVAGGAPRTIAYLYGGQGTINVPSWSPDGKRLAFVSNTAGIPAASP